MKKYILFSILFFVGFYSFSQDYSLELGEKYWEDQLYITVTYNTLINQPENVPDSGFSYGFSSGYIKDIPFHKKGKWASGLGLGYSFDSFNHRLHIPSSNIFKFSSGENNKIHLHAIEIPIQLRWRNSNAKTYAFWRVYAGARLSYNFYNSFKSDVVSVKNMAFYNNFQTGLELSMGYNSLNFYIYYGLSPIYKKAVLGDEVINTRMAKFGLIMYML